MDRCFKSAEILLPKAGNFDKWSVIACDQHTSEPVYWENVKEYVGDELSTLNLILPEAYLHCTNQQQISEIWQTMYQYLQEDAFEALKDSYIYVERTLLDGSVRQGLVGVIDLLMYDIDPKDNTKVFATEETVPERVPPRMAVRTGAPLEFSHCVVFCNDKDDRIVGSVCSQKQNLEKVYDFDLMTGGGHIRGWKVDGAYAQKLDDALLAYEKDNIYLVGDGNHSLLTAKRCYEQLRSKMSEEMWLDCPARYAMVELENIHSDAMRFEPIYRVIADTDVQKFLADFKRVSADEGTAVQLLFGAEQEELILPVNEQELAVAFVQNFLDGWLKGNPGQIDYIHGEDVVRQLAQKAGNVGILLPEIDKGMLFPYIRSGNLTPRKTFSIGHAAEKRYYLEGRKIL